MIRSTYTFAAAILWTTVAAGAAPPLAKPPSPPPRAPSASPRASSPLPRTSSPPGASAGSTTTPASFDLGVWTVHASSLDANFKTGDFSTPNKVVMTRSGGDVSADRANGNYKRQMLYLNGHVVVHDTQGSVQSMAGSSSQQGASPSTLTADKAEIDGAAKMYKATGNVHYVQADTVVNADTGTLNDIAHTLVLEGSVHITQGTRSMAARRVLYNTVTGTAHAEGDVTMQFPGELHRTLATPRPLRIPKNPVTQPVPSAAP
jgi:lipopolysaccharide assembly outer membrane protein LptD (OstA)